VKASERLEAMDACRVNTVVNRCFQLYAQCKSARSLRNTARFVLLGIAILGIAGRGKLRLLSSAASFNSGAFRDVRTCNGRACKDLQAEATEDSILQGADKSCASTSSYQVIDVTSKSWTMQSLESVHGQSLPKPFGGDEFYMSIVCQEQQQPLVAYTVDMTDGRYLVKFRTNMEINTHIILQSSCHVVLTLQYTCGFGSLPPPLKANFSDGLYINKVIPVNSTCALGHRIPTMAEVEPNRLNLASFDSLHLIGDSLMNQFLAGRTLNVTYTRIQAPLASDTVQNYFLVPIQNAIRGKLKNNTQSRVLIVLNSGVWDLLEDGTNSSHPYMSVSCCHSDFWFKDHLTALDSLLNQLTSEFKHVKFAWKSMTAAHVHRIGSCKGFSCRKRSKYMSNSRAYRIFESQKKLLAEKYVNVHFINLYNLTFNAAHLTREDDGRHYVCDRLSKQRDICDEMWSHAFLPA